jgi:DnaJ-domain-containing protein 1
MFERTDPKTLKMWLLLAAIIYVVLPFDLIPDLLGMLGRIDDLAMMALLAWFYRNHLKQFVKTAAGHEATGHSTGTDFGQDDVNPPKGTMGFDAYKVLGVTRSASSDAIKAAYRARMQEYHPDKVAHLGEELQNLALEKSQDIQRAYRQLQG